ncbi:glyoxalase family protein [hydrothermal vent metagenome]|uniref:Glyoxalase family protein n=1 Tax=hydrothermal vent metagenome TaxID=652676 RepID=A0A3B0XKP9_9ZZZZ
MLGGTVYKRRALKAVIIRVFIDYGGVKVGVLSIHHVSLVVADTQRAVNFYHGVLGLEVCQDRPDLGFPGAWLSIGEQQIHLLEVVVNPGAVDRPVHGGRDRHLAMSVDDLSDVEQKLNAQEICFTRSRSGRQALFCRDPDGNGVELIQSDLM